MQAGFESSTLTQSIIKEVCENNITPNEKTNLYTPRLKMMSFCTRNQITPVLKRKKVLTSHKKQKSLDKGTCSHIWLFTLA
jgi:hypothetical protein